MGGIKDTYMQVLSDLGWAKLGPTLGLLGLLGVALWFARKARGMHGRVLAGDGSRLDVGRVIGVCGVPGTGKTSFMVRNWAVPALKLGGRVVANFTVYPDPEWPGSFRKLKAENFGPDLMGIGSSLNLDETTGEPTSGWFIDTACTCGKDHDPGCSRPGGDVPLAPCCDGFRARRDCSCQGVFLFLDEGHAFVPANGSKSLPVDLLTWFTMCRKNHLMIVWGTQYYKWVNSGVRRLSEQVFMCSKRLGEGQHRANLHVLDWSKGDIGRDPVATIDYDNRPIWKYYDTKEVIVASQTAHEIAGQLSRKEILAEMGRRRGTSAAPRPDEPAPGFLRLLPPSTTTQAS